MSPPRIVSLYFAAIVMAIFIDVADALPQYVLLGLKSTNGVIKSPRPTRRALNVPSVLIVSTSDDWGQGEIRRITGQIPVLSV